MKLVMINNEVYSMSETQNIIYKTKAKYDINLQHGTSIHKMKEELSNYKSHDCVYITADERPLLLIPELFEIDDVYIYRDGAVKPIRECSIRQLRDSHNIFKLYLAGEFEF